LLRREPGAGLTTKQTLETAARCAEDRATDAAAFAKALETAKTRPQKRGKPSR